MEHGVTGDIKTKRVKRPMWVRWEVTREVAPHGWVVAYGFTRRGALSALQGKP